MVVVVVVGLCVVGCVGCVVIVFLVLCCRSVVGW